MITIKHVLKDGTQLDDITGHVIKAEDHPLLYEVISNIEKKEGDEHATIQAPD